MKNMIDRILSIDKEARKIKDEIQKENVTLEEEIKQRKKEIRESYLERAVERVNRNRELEEKSSREKILKMQEYTKEKLKELENIYKEHKDEWAKRIVENVRSR